VAEPTDVPEGVLPPRDLVTIIGNLLDNAIDAAVTAAPPRWVEVNASIDDTLVLYVRDSGAGPADVERAFQRGWSTKDAGRGLGLALVEQAVRRHGGTIEVAGSAFTVRLPVHSGQPA
jgi:two-component system CitB family sensor kinase